jgi:hypothetical protein
MAYILHLDRSAKVLRRKGMWQNQDKFCVQEEHSLGISLDTENWNVIVNR